MAIVVKTFLASSTAHAMHCTASSTTSLSPHQFQKSQLPCLGRPTQPNPPHYLFIGGNRGGTGRSRLLKLWEWREECSTHLEQPPPYFPWHFSFPSLLFPPRPNRNRVIYKLIFFLSLSCHAYVGIASLCAACSKKPNWSTVRWGFAIQQFKIDRFGGVFFAPFPIENYAHSHWSFCRDLSSGKRHRLISKTIIMLQPVKVLILLEMFTCSFSQDNKLTVLGTSHSTNSICF